MPNPPKLQKLQTLYFTFGFDHAHRIDGRTYAADTIVAITAEDPRSVMFDMFGSAWATSYRTIPGFAMRRGLPIVDVVDTPEGRVVTGGRRADGSS